MLARLPETYATALRLRARGLDDAAIATALELEPEAIPALLQLAQAKLETLSTLQVRSGGKSIDATDEGVVADVADVRNTMR
jgi:hypothetical protein